MTTKVTSIIDLAPNYECIILDASGVFWGGSKLGFYPGAIDTIKALGKMGKKVAILSNATFLSAKQIAKYAGYGLELERDYAAFLSSGQCMRNMLEDGRLGVPGRKFYVMFGDHPHFGAPHNALFADLDYERVDNLEDADFVYVGIPHIDGVDLENPDEFKAEVSRVAASGKPMVCANPDKTAPEGNPPRPVVRQGKISEMCEELGAKVIYAGKPFASAFQEVFKVLGMNTEDKQEVLMVGDTPETDVLGGNQFGIATALVTEGHGNAAKRIQALFNCDRQAFLNSLTGDEVPTHVIGEFVVKE